MDPTDIQKLRSLTTFEALVDYLRDELDWPIEAEDVEKVAFEYNPRELGIDPQYAVKIESIRQIRPLAEGQPWGVFYVEFESKQLPVLVLRRILHTLVPASRRHDPDRPAWKMSDLLFISSQGTADNRSISFAYFCQEPDGKSELRTFSWDVHESHLFYIKNLNLEALRWPQIPADKDAWRAQWGAAFTVPHRYVPTTAQMLAEEMASIARQIRGTVLAVYDLEHSGGPLHQLHLSLKMSLINDLTPDDFADMYAQTVTYGLFAAAATQQGEFASSDTAALIAHTNPFLRELLWQLMDQESVDLEGLGVSELTDLLKRVNMRAILQDFGRQKRGEDPVIHFYETFMRQYDPVQKTRRGEFYTPDPVVSFIVRSVDYLLEHEFGYPDGLADTGVMRWKGADVPRVQVLDPATGTGTFLKYVIQVIWDRFYDRTRKISAAERESRWKDYVRQHLLPRLYGFELKMAPYTIAHMKVSMALQEKGFEFAEGERLRIYLSNTLQPAHEVARLDTPALAHEAEKANEVKNNVPVTVVIGNPPYSYDSTNTGEWISNLVQEYYFLDGKSLKEANPKGLKDDYVKFMRFTEHIITRRRQGIASLITNHGYLDNPTFRGMRQHLLQNFSDIYILDLHGNSRKKEVSPDGSKDENVFDIQTGVAICILIRREQVEMPANVFHGDLFGLRESKNEFLLLGSIKNIEWQRIIPSSPDYFFKPLNKGLSEEYNNGFKITEIMPTNSLGLFTARDDLVIQWSKESAVQVFQEFSKLMPEDARNKYLLGNDSRDWQVILAQRDISYPRFDLEKVKPIAYRPFDMRFTYFTGNSRGIICMPRPEVNQHLTENRNLAIITIRRSRDGGTNNFFVTRNIVDKSILSSLDNANVAPLYIFPEKSQHLHLFSSFMLSETGVFANFTKDFLLNLESMLNLSYLTTGLGNLSTTFGPENVLHFMYAVFYSPTYRRRYSEFLKLDFPRLPLTSNLELFRQLCGLGAQLVALHLLEDARLESNAIERRGIKFIQGSTSTIAAGFPKYEGGRVYVNPESHFEGVAEAVWNFHIGGYQVCHKWLKDRRGRELSSEDILHYQKIVVALGETIRIMQQIDNVIEQHGGWPIK